jgi:hypothetical protein
MLAYVLALVIGLGSLGIYLAAFFFPEIHRKEDFIWSGVGLFYALVLWVCAGRITGGVLLGQIASAALLGWFAWQTLTLRRSLTPVEQQTPIPSQDELQTKLQTQVAGLFRKGKSEAKTASTPVNTKVSSPAVTVIDKTTTQTQPPPVEASTTEGTAPTTTPEIKEESARGDADLSESPELVRPNPPDPKLVEVAKNSAVLDAPESSETTATPVEEIPPEVELAPPAEPPGPGDPEDRQAEP